MSRGLKLAVAAVFALLLHGLLLKLVAVPMVAEREALGTPERSAVAPEANGSNPTTAQDAIAEPPQDEAMDVGWPEPELPESEPEPARSKPKPAPSAPVSRPAREPAASERTIFLAPGNQSAGEAAVAPASNSYGRRVREHLARFAGNLPPGANGEARVQFVVQPDGRVSDVRLVKRSGHLGLDAVALRLPEIAQPLPSPGERAQRLEVPVQAVPQSQ